jgi:hypothetical protein
LEEASTDPVGYRAKLYSPPRQAQGSIYFNTLRNTIFNFHKPQWIAAQAESYLQDHLAGAANVSRTAEVLDQFRWYVREYETLGWTKFLTRLTVDISLSACAPADLAISGQIARVDLVPSGGYAGWILLSGDGRGWRQELRMPLSQEALARKMNVPINEIIVGVYAFRSRSVEHMSYSATEVREAHSSLERIVQRLHPFT